MVVEQQHSPQPPPGPVTKQSLADEPIEFAPCFMIVVWLLLRFTGNGITVHILKARIRAIVL